MPARVRGRCRRGLGLEDRCRCRCGLGLDDRWGSRDGVGGGSGRRRGLRDLRGPRYPRVPVRRRGTPAARLRGRGRARGARCGRRAVQQFGEGPDDPSSGRRSLEGLRQRGDPRPDQQDGGSRRRPCRAAGEPPGPRGCTGGTARARPPSRLLTPAGEQRRHGSGREQQAGPDEEPDGARTTGARSGVRDGDRSCHDLGARGDHGGEQQRPGGGRDPLAPGGQPVGGPPRRARVVADDGSAGELPAEAARRHTAGAAPGGATSPCTHGASRWWRRCVVVRRSRAAPGWWRAEGERKECPTSGPPEPSRPGQVMSTAILS
ncbi:hypothetical protein JD79_03281 [Geodermatophilus normandii]|uniref:Uncharacterized protein n=1 Tax=Geodermatophilus normandii TaxID=1137989 RepID=A0A317QM95_9ACTN|nr:hypothetical protein JD79_03281 [Geodermatophilus normandii]